MHFNEYDNGYSYLNKSAIKKIHIDIEMVI
jgi:hypothetical protein